MVAALEDPQDFWVHLNETVLFLNQLFISEPNLTLDPLLERLTRNREDYIYHKLPG